MNESALIVQLLTRLDSDLSGTDVVSADEVQEWPDGCLDALVQQGVVLPEAPAAAVGCDSCPDGHVEPVEVVEAGPGSERRYYIPCPVDGRVQVSAERLRRWRIALPGLAKTMAQLLGATGRAREVVRDRMWDLGWVEIGKRVHGISLVRGLYWPDQAQDAIPGRFLQTEDSRIVLSLSEPPQGCPASKSAVPLARLLHLCDGALSLDDRYLSSILAPGDHPYSPADFTFRKQGEYWVVSYEGKLSILKHSQGLEYLARLLASPNKEIAALTLVTRGKRAAPAASALAYQEMSEEQLAELDLFVSGPGDAGEILDKEAKQAYRQRLREIDVELSEAERCDDQGYVAVLRRDKEILLKELSAAVGLGGRGRKAASTLERARTAVHKSIARGIKQIGEHDEALALFLTNSIKTGNICVYQPDKEVTWNLNSSET